MPRKLAFYYSGLGATDSPQRRYPFYNRFSPGRIRMPDDALKPQMLGAGGPSCHLATVEIAGLGPANSAANARFRTLG